MEYPSEAMALNRATIGAGAGAPRPTPLNTIEVMAEHAERTAYLVSSFISRFRGTPEGDSRVQSQPVPAGHEGQLQRLAVALDRLDALAQQLNDIG